MYLIDRWQRIGRITSHVIFDSFVDQIGFSISNDHQWFCITQKHPNSARGPIRCNGDIRKATFGQCYDRHNQVNGRQKSESYQEISIWVLASTVFDFVHQDTSQFVGPFVEVTIGYLCFGVILPDTNLFREFWFGL